MSERVEAEPDPQVRTYRPPRRYSAEYKKRILAEYDSCDKAGKGAVMRREGLYTQLISVWRKQAEAGAEQALDQKPGRPKADLRDRRIAKLEAEKAQLAAELDKTRQVVQVQGKLSALLDQLATSSTMSGDEPR